MEKKETKKKKQTVNMKESLKKAKMRKIIMTTYMIMMTNKLSRKWKQLLHGPRFDDVLPTAKSLLKPANQEKAAKNAANRAKQMIPHTLGTISFARFRHRLELDDGRKYTREIPYLTVRSGLVGSAIDTLVCAYLPYRQTMVSGKQHSGHVRGVGFGVVPSQYLGRSSRTPVWKLEIESWLKRMMATKFPH
ncbi:Asparagine-rich protein (ARP protein) [Trifolium repens]|nr:Asparagine-rich protein (ARP protein) [Trifolium repens]